MVTEIDAGGDFLNTFHALTVQNEESRFANV